MDPGFNERQSYNYGSERDVQHQPQQRQQQQSQLLPHYAHHPGLLPPHLQQHQIHQSQPAFGLDQSEHMRGRDDFVGRHSVPASFALQQLMPGSGQVTSTTLHRSILHQYSEQSQSQEHHMAHTAPVDYGSDQAPTMIDTSATGQAFVSPDSPTHPQGSQEGGVVIGDQSVESVVEIETAGLDREVKRPPVPQGISTDMDTPKKRAVRLALAETQHNEERMRSLQQQSRTPDIWKPDLPIGLSLKFTPDGKRITGVRSERTLQKGAKFGPFNGKVVEESVGMLKDSVWEICLRGTCLYIDGQNKTHNNWMAFIESANFPEEQNLEAYQSYGDIYFRTTKVIDPGSELKVFYNEEYASRAGFKMKLNEVQSADSKESRRFNCTACDKAYPSAKRLLRHLKISHEPNRASELLPTVTWKPRKAMENEENENPKIAPSTTPPAKPAKSPKLNVKPPKVPSSVPKKVLVRSNHSALPDERFICPTCGKNFPTQGRLAAHETFHEYSTEHMCKTCGDSFNNSSLLAKHMLSHKEKIFKCDACGHGFPTKYMLYRHKQLSHPVKYTCRVCGMDFTKKRECGRHEKTHPDWKNFKAVQDKSRRRSRKPKKEYIPEGDADIDDGMFVFFPPENDADAEIQDEEEEEAAENLSMSKDMLGKRTNYYDRPRPYKCRFCPNRYLSRRAQYDHESERHTKRCRYKCAHCPSVFATENRYIEHVKRHVKNRPFQCPICPGTFASESALKNHQGEHTGLKPVKCDECGRGFRTRHFMTAHKRRMHKVQQMRYACSFCNKPFADKGNLIKHERRHKGIRPYVCLVCGRGFTSNYCLTSHSYTHTKERKFGCPHCDRKFTLNQHLTNHIFRAHTSKAEKEAKQISDTNAQTQEMPQNQQMPVIPLIQ